MASELFKTSDVDFAGYLLYKGYQLIPPPVQQGRFVVFTFKNSPELQTESLKYFNQGTSVDAYELASSVRKIRTLLREMKFRDGGDR